MQLPCPGNISILPGTGLGAGIVINNQLYSGLFSSAGELGGIPYSGGTVEDYCRGKFFLHTCGMEGSKVLALPKPAMPRHSIGISNLEGTLEI